MYTYLIRAIKKCTLTLTKKKSYFNTWVEAKKGGMLGYLNVIFLLSYQGYNIAGKWGFVITIPNNL